jgi:hypothetical protein
MISTQIRKGFVAKTALIRLLIRVISFVNPQMLLRHERLVTFGTTVGFISRVHHHVFPQILRCRQPFAAHVTNIPFPVVHYPHVLRQTTLTPELFVARFARKLRIVVGLLVLPQTVSVSERFATLVAHELFGGSVKTSVRVEGPCRREIVHYTTIGTFLPCYRMEESVASHHVRRFQVFVAHFAVVFQAVVVYFQVELQLVLALKELTAYRTKVGLCFGNVEVVSVAAQE